MIAIDVAGLTKRYGQKTVVDGVDLQVEKGEIMGFLGPNGSGKTTTIRMICGLLTPDAGSGRVLGMDLGRDATQIRHEVGYMTQRFSFYEDLTIEENLQFVARLYDLRPTARHVDAVLAELGLQDRRHDLAGTLSGGWKQRLALAACIMHRPKLLLLDEPTAGVDPEARREFWDHIHALAAGGMTVLVSTHYMDEAERCHRISYILQGRLLVAGTPAEIISASGLAALDLVGHGLEQTAQELNNEAAVDQATIFGNALHVVGTDARKLRASIDPVATRDGLAVRESAVTIEDVFIDLVTKSEKAA
ncbi:ABC transporter ATP-binding protein [Pseudaestuariivita atlantica]|uniref:Multidrug ABC transporter ATP-binding protein n=1 Tax=Pseudaestuariivita atlantica TaxID=1317121 RepID=A0A0L1JS24_9RHOB|nr:ABC transporter ATP-binding protein [Pseudaestuariivita atlantica]KNG94594.1 multidrug ABC transporter ATP-binding protein [Pseudaestuariivita atlantica]